MAWPGVGRGCLRARDSDGDRGAARSRVSCVTVLFSRNYNTVYNGDSGAGLPSPSRLLHNGCRVCHACRRLPSPPLESFMEWVTRMDMDMEWISGGYEHFFVKSFGVEWIGMG